MTIVSPACESAPLLEVTVLHARDAAAAASGEADRLLLVAEPEAGGRSPEPATVSAVVRETDLPVRVLLRPTNSLLLEDNPYGPLVTLARTYRELGAAGVSFGFLDRDNEIDRRACHTLAEDLGGFKWTFHAAFDSALDSRRAWREVIGMPHLDAVVSAGSARGLAAGGDELIERAAADPAIAELLLVSGHLDEAQVPWLVRAGVRQFGLWEEVRQDGSWTKSSVDATAVRAWRLLIDDAHQQALGVSVD